MGLQFFVFILIIMVIGVVAGIFLFRFFSTNEHGALRQYFMWGGVPVGGAVASTLNAVQIMVLNNLYTGMAEKLNNYGT